MSNLSQFLVPATSLKSATTTIVIAAAAAPVAGQILTAVSPTAAAWSTPQTNSFAKIDESISHSILF